MAVSTGAAILGSAAIGALANRGSDQTSTTQQMVNVAPAGGTELGAVGDINSILQQLKGFSAVGPGQQDVAGGYQAQNQLASMLQQFAQGGYAPNAQDQSLARMQLAPQFEQARQSQIGAEQAFRQQAARSGRGPMDFAFTNRLNQNTSNQMQMLAAQQSQLAAQQPMQRLGFMQDFASLKQGLASQAMQNRMAISNLGASIRDSERNLRLQSAGRTGISTQQAGDQTGNMLMGGIAGIGSGLKLMNQFGGGSSNFGSSPVASSGGGYLGANINF